MSKDGLVGQGSTLLDIGTVAACEKLLRDRGEEAAALMLQELREGLKDALKRFFRPTKIGD